MCNGSIYITIKLLILIILSNLVTPLSFAQSLSESHLKITGLITDSTTQKPLAYVTVVVQEKRNSQATTHTLTSDAGIFQIDNLAYKEYKLILSYVGYKTKTLALPPFTSPTINLGTIVLVPTATELEEVQVVTPKPLIEQSFDRTIYNVEADPETNSLNTLDMLRKVPLLTIDAEDNLQLRGNYSYQILINGKRSALFAGNPSEILKTLPANSIKKVEVITNPSARYEAAGASGIINIVTHKKSISGYNGAINLSAENPKGYTAGSFLSTTAGKFSASGRYNYRQSESPINRGIFFRDDMINLNRLRQTSESSGKNTSQSINGLLGYQLSQQDLITASYSHYNSNNTNNHTLLAELLSAAGELSESYMNLNNSTGKTTGRDISIEYEHRFKKNEQQLLSFSFNTTNSNSSSHSDFILQPLLNYTGRVSTTNNKDKTREHTLQADYVQPIGKQTLELGAKSILEKNTSNYYYQNRDEETGAFVLDSSMSNSFSYHQDIHAAYISLNLSMGKWGLRTGARLEATKLNASFLSSGTGVIKEYYSLFPNASLSRSIKESGRISLSYNQRIVRPGLYALDPYVDLTAPLNISYGNPDLEPATSHTFQLEFGTFVKTTSFNLNAFHTFANNSIEQYTTVGKDSVARTTFSNIGQNRNYGLTISSNTTIFKRLSLNINAGTNYVSYTSTLEGEQQTNEGFTYNLRGAANLRMGKTWRISGNLNYNSPNIMVQGTSSGYTWSSLSVNKQFLKDGKASVNLAVRSPFQKHRRSISEISNATFYQHRESYLEIRQFSLSFNYRFGKLK